MKKFWHSILFGWVYCHWFRYEKKSELRRHLVFDLLSHFCCWFFFLGFICVASGILVLDPVADDLVPLFEYFIRITFIFVSISLVDSFIYLCCEDKQFVKDIKRVIIEKEKLDERVNVNYE